MRVYGIIGIVRSDVGGGDRLRNHVDATGDPALSFHRKSDPVPARAVLPQVDAVPVRLRALGAAERALVRVRAEVRGEVDRLSEAAAALRARVRLRARVHPLVRFERQPRAEASVTVAAGR